MTRSLSMLAAALALTFPPNALSVERSLEASVQLEGQKAFPTSNVHGSCAQASVTITGIDADTPIDSTSIYLDSQDAFAAGHNGYISPTVEIVINEPPDKQKVATIHLSELSLVRCISTKHGKKVLVGTVCTGNSISCASPDYYLIDAERVSNAETMPGCDATCINKKAGGRIIR